MVPGAGGGDGSEGLMGTEVRSETMSKVCRWWWGWLHSSVNVPNAVELGAYDGSSGVFYVMNS